MFEENEPDEDPGERVMDPAQHAREKCDEFRMHAELAAVFEGVRKFEAEIKPNLSADIARNVQRTIAKLEKSKLPDTPVIKPEMMEEAGKILNMPSSEGLSTNDYHIHRRPGETMIIRWLAGEQVETFYERLQAHFDAALNHYRAEERSAKEWKQDEQTAAYLGALDKLDVKMAERYLREVIKQHRVIVLSTQTADEMDILHLTEFLMSVDVADVVGNASAPPDVATERDRAWFFKLFSLRGYVADEEKMCFFTYLQKAEDTFDLE